MPDLRRDEPCISGALACSLRGVASDLLGAPTIGRALERVPESLRSAYENATPVGWIPLPVVEAAFSELAVEVDTNLAELHERVARRSIELTIRKFWRVLLRVTTDSALVSRTPSIFARSYNRGKLESRVVSPGRGEVKLYDWPQVPDWPLRGTRVGIEVGLTVAGRRNVQATCSRTSTGAVFIVSWR
jgi:hypothetical protein